MKIIWDDGKNHWLEVERGISFEEISEKLLNQNYYEILENPTREDQLYFILELKDYTWVVPFLINENEDIILKTAFPSRKYHKIYGGNKNG